MKVIENVWPEWKVEEIIGKGSYGAVFRCVDTKGNRSAVKVISVPQNDSEIKPRTSEKMTSEQIKEYYKDIADDMVKEIEILKALKGTKNIVEIYEAEVVEKEDGIGWYILIRMELLTVFDTYSKKRNNRYEKAFGILWKSKQLAGACRRHGGDPFDRIAGGMDAC